MKIGGEELDLAGSGADRSGHKGHVDREGCKMPVLHEKWAESGKLVPVRGEKTAFSQNHGGIGAFRGSDGVFAVFTVFLLALCAE